MSLAERTSKGQRMTPASRLAALAVTTLAAMPAAAQAQGAPLIRDAEIEQLLRDYSAPVLRAAGLAQQNIRIVVINERAFNAFVADGRRIFINTGTLSEATTPNEVIGVLAHETGHIAGGHLAKLREQLRSASTQSIIAMSWASAPWWPLPKAAAPMRRMPARPRVTAPQEMIRRSLLAYLRAQEEQADRAGVKFLTATGQSPKGMHDTFKRLADQLLFAARFADPYLQSHPMPAERVRRAR